MIVRDLTNLIHLENFITSHDQISLDIETNSLNVRNGIIIGIGFSTTEQAFYLPTFEWKDEDLVEVVPREKVIGILNMLHDKQLTGWNLSFDMRFIYHYYGIDLIKNIYIDGMLLKHTVDEERPFRLKEVSAMVFGTDATKEQEEMKESIRANGGGDTDFYKCDLDIMAKYCMQDCKLNARLIEHYLPKLVEENLENFFFLDEVMPLYREVTIPMELKGVPVDLELIKSTKSEIREDIESLEQEILRDIDPMLDDFKDWFLNKEYPAKNKGAFAQAVCQYAELDLPKTASGNYSLSSANVHKLRYSPFKEFLQHNTPLPAAIVREIQMNMHGDAPMFNISSKDHLKRLFFDRLQVKPTSKTAKGNPQVNHFFLEDIKDRFDFVPKIITYNKLCKLESAYVDRFLENQEEGMFYPSFMQHRTISGRYGSDIQQLPRPMEPGDAPEVVVKYNNRMRKFFISGKGYKFIDADYESLEPHVFAHVSGDERLRDIFRKGHDFYSTIAIKTEGLEGVSADKKADNYLGKVNKNLRQKAKTYSLGIIYGMGAFALGKTLDIPQSAAERLVEGYLSGFPDLRNWMDKSAEECKLKGRIKVESGRVRRFPKAPGLYRKYGEKLLDALELWKEYNDHPAKYQQMKYLHKEMKNAVNNSRNVQIQGLAASIVNRSAIAINRYIKAHGIDGYVCAQIHDQLIVRVADEYAEHMKVIQQDLMESTYTITIPLKAPAEIAENWYDGH